MSGRVAELAAYWPPPPLTVVAVGAPGTDGLPEFALPAKLSTVKAELPGAKAAQRAARAW